MELHRDSGLLAASCDDLVVRLVDVETRRVVRELRGFKGRILDTVRSSLGCSVSSIDYSQCFSPDSRWLIASSLDSTIRSFDIPTGRLVDAFRTVSIATSITFSPTGDFLATAHVDSLGVHLWSVPSAMTRLVNAERVEGQTRLSSRTLHCGISMKRMMCLRSGWLPSKASRMIQASTRTRVDLSLILSADLGEIDPLGAPELSDIYTTPDQLEGLLTLSLMPRSRWQTLLNLETIRVCQ